MAYEKIADDDIYPFKAASAIAARKPVKLDTVADQVVLAATNNVRPLGFVTASAGRGEGLSVFTDSNVVKAIAAASVGVGVEVAVASTNGDLGPLTTASGVGVWAVGLSLSPAQAGETFSVLIRARQTGGLA